MAKKQFTKSIARSTSKIYFEKAQDFYESMQNSYDNQKWNTVGLTAVHCAISLSDALLAYYGGIRNTNKDHKSAGELLKRYIQNEAIDQQEKRFAKIISKKNLIEYEGRVFTRKDADDIRKHTERFFIWTKEVLKI